MRGKVNQCLDYPWTPHIVWLNKGSSCLSPVPDHEKTVLPELLVISDILHISVPPVSLFPTPVPFGLQLSSLNSSRNLLVQP